MISMPKTADERKQHPVTTGVLDYFPDAILAIANVSLQGNDQHNPGQPLHWDRSKSQDEADALVRHLMERGTKDSDGTRHSAKMAWRALALLQKEIEEEREHHVPGVMTIQDEVSVWTGSDAALGRALDSGLLEPYGPMTVYADPRPASEGWASAVPPAGECEWCGYPADYCECVMWDKGL